MSQSDGAEAGQAREDDLLARIRERAAASGRKLVALDDDPTGVQTVHDVAVLARWEVDDLVAELRDPRPVCFILTNSRSLPEPDAIALNREIAVNLRAASERAGIGVVVASRSDSTLRGHFPAETDTLAAVLGGIDGVLLIPAFFEGGRVTRDDVHYLRDGARLIPAGATEFARDASFGYHTSNLREWVAEKTGGRIPASEVASLSLDLIRKGGAGAVADALADVANGRVVVVNALEERDLEIVALGVLAAEAAGKRFLYRTSASFVSVRAGLAPRPLLSRADLLGPDAPRPLPGLVVVGSHVRRSGEQLAALLRLPSAAPLELRVPGVLEAATRDEEIARVGQAASAALVSGATPIIFTSRQVISGGGPAEQLRIGRAVSSALVESVRRLEVAPGWVIGKGGITSSDIGTNALTARRAIVLGQVKLGVPVWRLGPETRYPGLPYIVFPGNVGAPETLAEVVEMVTG